jgi:hypothetical protein
LEHRDDTELYDLHRANELDRHDVSSRWDTWGEWKAKKDMGDHEGADELFSEEEWGDCKLWKKVDRILADIVGTEYFCKACRESGETKIDWPDRYTADEMAEKRSCEVNEDSCSEEEMSEMEDDEDSCSK